MELKLISLLSGIIGAGIFTIISLSPQALFSVSQMTIFVEEIPHRYRSNIPMPEKLALNGIQQEQIAKIKLKLNHRINEILTLEQQQEFKNELDRGLLISSAINTISISEAQKKELFGVFRWAQIQIEQILTPEQLDYLKKRTTPPSTSI